MPNPKGTNREIVFKAPLLAFSADGTKFAAGTIDGVVSVWDVRSKIPLKVFEVDVVKSFPQWQLQCLQFSSGIPDREVLVFLTVVSRYFYSELPTYLLNKWRLERGFFFNCSENHPSD